MPIAVDCPLASRMMLRPEPLSCACSGITRVAGASKCSSKSVLRTSIAVSAGNLSGRSRHRRRHSAGPSTVDFAPMADLQHQDNQSLVFQFTDGAVVTDAISPQAALVAG